VATAAQPREVVAESLAAGQLFYTFAAFACGGAEGVVA